MLDENSIVYGETINAEHEHRTFEFKCSCGCVIKLNSNVIDDYIYSDPHMPNDEYLICPECEKAYKLYKKGVEVFKEGKKFRLFSDGTFVLMEDFDGVITRIS